MLGDFINKVKKSFTLLEVLIICGAFSIVIVSIIGAINRSYAFMGNTRMKVRAVNLAREGVEMMFNIRDTNWREHSGEKDKYWLGVGSGDVDFNKDVYILKEKENGSGDTFIYAERFVRPSSISSDDIYDGFFDKIDTLISKARLTFTGTYSYLTGKYESNGTWKFDQVTGDIQNLLGSDGEFYRIVRVFDIVDKLGNEGCSGEHCPKEMRFCVKVFYRYQGEHETELCSIMTNFEE